MENLDLKQQLAQSGKVLTAAQREKIAEHQAQAIERILKEYELNAPDINKELSLLDRLLVRVPSAVAVIQDVGDTIITVSRSIIVSLLPVVLALALYVEAQRVMHGLQLFEASESLAVLGAWLLVIANLLLELVIHWKNMQAGYVAERKTKRSLRLMWRDLRYFIGLDDKNGWQARHHGPAYRYEVVLGVVTWSILLLAVAGSMTTALDGQPGNWFTGFVAIFTESTLLEMVTWGAGLLFALTVVKVSQSLTSYVAARSVEFAQELGRRASRTTDDHPDLIAHREQRDRAIEQAKTIIEREHLLALLAKQGEKRPLAESALSGRTAHALDDNEDTEPTPSVNGHTANGNKP